MNKSELISDFKSKGFVKTVFQVKLEAEENNVNLYSIGFFEKGKTTNSGIKRSCQFYVLNENEDTEEAIYKYPEPNPIIREENELIKQYSTQIETYKLKVVEKNDNYIVAEGYETQSDSTVKKVRYIADKDEIKKMYV